jgi:hypothetical protein
MYAADIRHAPFEVACANGRHQKEEVDQQVKVGRG